MYQAVELLHLYDTRWLTSVLSRRRKLNCTFEMGYLMVKLATVDSRTLVLGLPSDQAFLGVLHWQEIRNITKYFAFFHTLHHTTLYHMISCYIPHDTMLYTTWYHAIYHMIPLWYCHIPHYTIQSPRYMILYTAPRYTISCYTTIYHSIPYIRPRQFIPYQTVPNRRINKFELTLLGDGEIQDLPPPVKSQ